MTKETTSIQVEEKEKNQLAAEEEGEKMQNRVLSQKIEQLIEVTYMEMEQDSQNEDVVLIPSAPQAILLVSTTSSSRAIPGCARGCCSH